MNKEIPVSSKSSTPQKPYEALIKQCWEDPDFKARLLADPEVVIREAGLPIPVGVDQINAIENSASQMTLIIPPNPAEQPDGAVSMIAGGYIIFSRGGFSCDFIVHQNE
ncbi:MAG: NHLP leader peptide family RiPP precursor [Congregibacter sp.]